MPYVFVTMISSIYRVNKHFFSFIITWIACVRRTKLLCSCKKKKLTLPICTNCILTRRRKRKEKKKKHESSKSIFQNPNVWLVFFEKLHLLQLHKRQDSCERIFYFLFLFLFFFFYSRIVKNLIAKEQIEISCNSIYSIGEWIVQMSTYA